MALQLTIHYSSYFINIYLVFEPGLSTSKGHDPASKPLAAHWGDAPVDHQNFALRFSSGPFVPKKQMPVNGPWWQTMILYVLLLV